MDQWVYYSPEIDEIFTLKIKPPRPCQWYEFYVEDKKLLSFVTCLGRL